MTKHAQGTPVPNTFTIDSPHIDATIYKVISAIDAINLAQSSFQQISSLFYAIKNLTAEHEPVRRLAEVGEYLSEEWAYMNSASREQLDRELVALRAIQEAAK